MNMNKGVSLALVGASGVVGTKIIQLLEKREFPVDKFIPLGNSTVGSSIQFKNKEYRVSSLEEFSAEKGQFIIFSAGSSVAEKYARKFVAEGCFVIDLSSNFRYQDDVPLIIPEINGEVLKSLSKPSLIANPNCSTAQLLMALKPIHDQAEIKLLNIATYQAVSGTGKAALEELHDQTYSGDSVSQSTVYPKQIAFNVIPQCDIFLENNFTKEEMKLTWETHKILDPNIAIQATCVRVPVINGHSEAVFFRVSKEISREEIIEILENSPGIKVLDDPQAGLYPTPVENASDTEDVYVGRIRSQNLAGESWISMWIVADNVYGKGAALNAVQICEELLSTGILR
jgi:aspartate-semialdehyde dehydrogenase